eukprot:Gregarina_sp_Poly_1__3953@NODE_218_length_11257_cov_139_614120_g192_i0_p4_GENE_NODE_218_length_11257_cov_139_614120_g192_i0NODE_218_length_11257_cov_139_614120_g192_i0_p4_ORF_typecomplete_len477_score74_34pPIWI_RE_Y/PF18156_1/0_37_NODE_218_length_11257_cov_139_614120_g192_i039745404
MLPHLPNGANSTTLEIVRNSRPARNKLHQLVAELWLFYRPKTWSALNALLGEALASRPHTDVNRYLLPTQLLFGSLREIAWQLSSSPDGPGFSTNKTSQSRKSSWELGRILASHRMTIISELTELMHLCWNIATEDLLVVHQQAPFLMDQYLASFAEIIQLQVPLLVNTNNVAQLVGIKWELFASQVITANNSMREICECLCEVNKAITTRKNKRYVKEDLPPEHQQQYILAFIGCLTNAQRKYHPLIVSTDGSTDDLMMEGVWVIHSLMDQLSLFLERSQTQQLQNHSLTIMANIALALCHPSLSIAASAVSVLRALHKLQLYEPTATQQTYRLLWLRCLRIGDPQLRGLVPLENADWLIRQIPMKVLNHTLTSLGVKELSPSFDWDAQIVQFLDIEDEALSIVNSTAEEVSSFGAKLASIKLGIRTLTQDTSECQFSDELKNIIIQSMMDIAGSLMQTSEFSAAAAQSYLPVSL